MSIINFNEKFEKCYKDMKLVQKDYIETIKDDLKFKVGDKVKIDVIFESDKDKLLYGNGKIFDIIEIVPSYELNDNINYRLNTGTEINLFKEKFLKLV